MTPRRALSVTPCVAMTGMGTYFAIVVMRAVCPRCQRPARAPTAWSSAWRCDLHGEIYPLAPARLPSTDGLHALVRQARVPVLLPWPLPPGWLVSGFTGAGDERTGTRASAVSLSGPNPLGGPADLLIIAEEPGIGLGAGLAGLPGPDPGDGFASSQPNAAVEVDNHDAPLWLVESDGKAVFVGEVSANWVWLVLWPDTAGTLLLEPLPLRDLRDPTQELDVPFGALSPRLPLSPGGTTPRTSAPILPFSNSLIHVGRPRLEYSTPGARPMAPPSYRARVSRSGDYYGRRAY